jgi:hypothetical protein
VELEVSGQDDALFPAPDDGGTAAVLLQLADMGEAVGALIKRLTAVEREVLQPEVPGYRPIPAPRWWLLTGDERAEAIGRLASWVEQVYRPCYGHLAARLPGCWAEHPLCLFVLDWLSELHSVHYLRAFRSQATLAGQAEWHMRQLPAAADLMAADARACEHARAARLNGAVR